MNLKNIVEIQQQKAIKEIINKCINCDTIIKNDKTQCAYCEAVNYFHSLSDDVQEQLKNYLR